MNIIGNKTTFKTSVSLVTVFQTKKWKGSLNMFMIKNNQAAVPINSFFGKRIAKKYTFAIGPAKLPIIVENPAKKPAVIENIEF